MKTPAPTITTSLVVKNVVSFVSGLALLAIGLSSISLFLAYNADHGTSQLYGVYTHVVSGVIPTTPYVQLLSCAGAPLSMDLPSDFSAYATGIRYSIWSTTPEPHRIVIVPLSGGPSWDGAGHYVVTFGGTVGAGLVFLVLTKNMLVITASKNVTIN